MLPVFPSLVGVMPAVPGARAVTRPEALTVTAAGLPLDHVTTRFVAGLLLASSRDTAICCVCAATRKVVVAVRFTVLTGGIVTVALPVLPSLVTVICDVPDATAVTSPDAETVATAGVDELQTTTRLVAGLLLASSNCTVACVVWPG